jgi:hypothetical protein
MSTCTCTHTLASHRGYRATAHDRQGCLVEECSCTQFVSASKNNGVTMADDDKKLALWMIKQHQRMIHEIRQRYGITDGNG